MTVHSHLRALTLVAIAALLWLPSTVGADRGLANCRSASIRQLQLPAYAAVDEVRVILARNSPSAGAATVRVDAGRFGRRMRVHGGGSYGLKFSPALTGKHFEVALDPVFDAQQTACVERILLFGGGAPIASVRP